MHQNMQAVKMRFKPLPNSSYDTDIIIELASRLKAIVDDNKGAYTPRLYPTKSKKPLKTPCNMIVYIRMYTTIASRLKGYSIHYKEARDKHSENVQKSHYLKSQPSHLADIRKKIKQAETLLTINSGYRKVWGVVPWKHLKSLIYYTSVPSVKKINPSVFRNISIHYCNVYLLDV